MTLLKNLAQGSWSLLFSWGLFAGAWAAGQSAIRLIKPKTDIGLVAKTGLGLGTISLFTFWLTVLGLAFREVFGILYGGLILNGLFQYQFWRKRYSGDRPSLRPQTNTEHLLLAIFLLLILINITLCFLPPTARDSLRYHLTVPRLYLETHRLHYIPFDFHSAFPQNIEMLYVWALALSGPGACQLIHCGLGILTAFLILGFLKKITPLRYALLGALLFYATPLVIQLSSWAYVDLGFCLYCLLGLVILLECEGVLDRKVIVLIGVFAGLALGTKYIGLLNLGLLGVAIMVAAAGCKKIRPREVLSLLLLYLSAAVITAAAWYGKNFIALRNPLYPFCYRWFDGLYWDKTLAEWYNTFLQLYGWGYTPQDLLLLPWRLAVWGKDANPRNFDGVIGIGYLLCVPLLFLSKPKVKKAIIMLYIILYSLYWSQLSQQARFLLPALVAFSIVVAWNLAELSVKSTLLACVYTTILILISLFHLISPLKHIYQDNPLGLVLGKTPESSYLWSRVKYYPAIWCLNHTVPRDKKVMLVFISNVGYYCQPPFVSDALFEAYTLRTIIRQSRTTADIKERLRGLQVEYILIDESPTLEFFSSTLTEEERGRFVGFVNEHLLPLWTKNTCRLYRLK